MGWQDYIILYEDNEGLVRLQELLKYPSRAKDMKVTIRQLIPGPGNDYRYFSQWSSLFLIHWESAVCSYLHKSAFILSFPMRDYITDPCWRKSSSRVTGGSSLTALQRKFIKYLFRRNKLGWWQVNISIKIYIGMMTGVYR